MGSHDPNDSVHQFGSPFVHAGHVGQHLNMKDLHSIKFRFVLVENIATDLEEMMVHACIVILK